MPTYFYTAITAAGEKMSGAEVAEDERHLVSILREKGYLLTTATTEEAKSRFSSLRSPWRRLRSVSLTDKLLFTRNLQVMVAAGTPLPRALEVLTEQTKNKLFSQTIDDVRNQVRKGRTLSEAMAEHARIFPELFINMLKVGEESGTLENVLTQLSLQLEREHKVKSQVFGALLYPAVIMCAMIGIGTLMLVVVVPQLAAVFEDLGVELPLTTRIIIGLGTFLSTYWFFVIPGFLLSLFGAYHLWKTKQGKRFVDKIVLKIPILSGILQKANTALMTRTLSSLISAGVPIVRTIEITSRVLGNTYFQESLTISAVQVGKGSKFSDTLREYRHLYPAVVTQMIAVGEETGETSKILSKLAEFFEGEVENVTKNLTSIIEPILMLAIGAVVGFFAISMIQPMYSMLGSL